MARNGKGNPPIRNTEGSEEELMVVVLKLKGSGDTLKRGFDTLNNAFQAMIVPPAPTRKPVANGATKHLPGRTPTEDEMDDSHTLDAEYEEVGTEEEEEAPTAPTKAKRSTYKFLSDFPLDISDVHWQDYAKQKNPKTEHEKYLVAAEWITKNAGNEVFSANHVFSCFRAMSWSEMKDFTQPMRQMKSKNSYFENPSRKSWKLTGLGLKAATAISNLPE